MAGTAIALLIIVGLILLYIIPPDVIDNEDEP